MSNEPLTGARLSHGGTLSDKFKMLIRLHRIEAKRSVNEILTNPISNFMTVLVIAIALALPAGLQVLLDNAKVVSEGWDGASRISLYLKIGTSNQKLESLATTLRAQTGIQEVDIVTAEQALEDFKQDSGFSEAIEQLDSNPLPSVLVIQPAPSHNTPEASEKMLNDFKAIPEVEIAQLDLEWVRKLYALLQLADKAAQALGFALALAVLLIVGNTIRLSVHGRKEEIEVVKLVGATDAFIRRPFLYTGFWYGLFAGITCWGILAGSLTWLEDPISHLAGLYQSQYQVSGLNLIQSAQLIGISCGLGLLGSWLSVGRHIKQIEPR